MVFTDIKGFQLNNPHSNNLKSKWLFFNYKNKLFQISIAEDLKFNKIYYDIDFFLYDKLNIDDFTNYMNRISDIKKNGFEIDISNSKKHIKNAVNDIEHLISCKDYKMNKRHKSLNLSSDLNSKLENFTFKAYLRGYIREIYKHLIRNIKNY